MSNPSRREEDDPEYRREYERVRRMIAARNREDEKIVLKRTIGDKIIDFCRQTVYPPVSEFTYKFFETLMYTVVPFVAPILLLIYYCLKGIL